MTLCPSPQKAYLNKLSWGTLYGGLPSLANGSIASLTFAQAPIRSAPLPLFIRTGDILLVLDLL